MFIRYKLVLLVLLVLLSFGIIRTKLLNQERLSENQSVLLLENQRPIAILFFNVDNKQLVLTDLRQNNFDLRPLNQGSFTNQEASTSGALQKNLFYAFLLNTVFDKIYEYSSGNLDKANLLTFFKDQRLRAEEIFLKDKELLWKEQAFDQRDSQLVSPVFNCPVVLINTTSEVGLANASATILEKSAFSVIQKDSNNDNLTQSKVFYDESEPTCEILLRKLQVFLPESLIVADKSEVRFYRASLVIYLGKDLAVAISALNR